MGQCFYDHRTLVVNFELVNWEMVRGYCDCILESITIVYPKKDTRIFS